MPCFRVVSFQKKTTATTTPIQYYHAKIYNVCNAFIQMNTCTNNRHSYNVLIIIEIT